MSKKRQKQPRMSPEACPWCHQTYELIGRNQKHHTQSEVCRKLQRNQKELLYYRNYLGEKEKAERRAKREAHAQATAKFQTISRPFRFAHRTAMSRFRWLLPEYRDDLRQDLFLALLLCGIRDPESPAFVDVRELRRVIERILHYEAKCLGFLCQKSNGTYLRMPSIDDPAYIDHQTNSGDFSDYAN